MPRSLIDCDVKITPALRKRFQELSLTPVCFYRNGSIPPEIVLTVKGSPKAYLADTPDEAITAAEADIYGGL